jgi:hypothetical protein
VGDPGVIGEEGELGGGLELDNAAARVSGETGGAPFGYQGAAPLERTGEGGISSARLGGVADIIALPSSDSASNKSGGSRSFSISDLRLIIEGCCKSSVTQT